MESPTPGSEKWSRIGKGVAGLVEVKNGRDVLSNANMKAESCWEKTCPRVFKESNF